MESLVANKPLLYSLLVSASAVVALGSGLLPEVMTQFQLVEFDTDVCIIHTQAHCELWAVYRVVYLLFKGAFTRHRAMGHHITQCYLPLNTSERAPP